MTEPSQYFKGRTVQEQMNEVIGYVDVRSAEVATDAIAADVAQVHQDMLDADADATAAAASAAAAAGTLANAVKKTGETSQSIAGNIEVSGTLKSAGTLYAVGDASVGGNLGVGGSTNVRDLTATGIVTVPTPTGNNYAANKKYVDDADALKADKTYVDTQDALKISITDINNYAVGLTGNQNAISGNKTFTSLIALVSTVSQAYNGYIRKLSNMTWASDTDIPASNVTIRLFSISASDDTTIARLNLVITNTGTPRFQLEWYSMENNTRVYHSLYLNS